MKALVAFQICLDQSHFFFFFSFSVDNLSSFVLKAENMAVIFGPTIAESNRLHSPLKVLNFSE